jgi:hypothetical protein
MSAPGQRSGSPTRYRKIKGGGKPGRRPGYFQRISLVMNDNRKSLSLKSMARINAGSRKSAGRAHSLLRAKKRKRSLLLRNT